LHRGDLQGALELAVEAQRGDEVLIRIARLLCDELRETDSIIRSGGEEFIVLMPRTDAGAAIACCERIRSAVNTDMWASAANGLRVTTSVGVATTDAATDLEALIRLADSASTRPSTSAEIGSSARRLLDERGRLLPLRGSSPLSHPGSG
jgi:diguanylate cyclase (GGDEF)-like protein